MSAKIICFFVMVIAFFSFYQQSPVFALGIIFVVIVGYLFYRKKKSKRKSMGSPYISQGGFRSSKYEKILSLLMVNQLMNSKSLPESSPPTSSLPEKGPSRDLQHEESSSIGLNVREMILDILQEE
jgi:hypothetical protein